MIPTVTQQREASALLSLADDLRERYYPLSAGPVVFEGDRRGVRFQDAEGEFVIWGEEWGNAEAIVRGRLDLRLLP